MKKLIFGLIAMAAGTALQAQQITMYGALSNFDVINDTGQPTYGFEIEIHGGSSIGGSFTWNRYGMPQVTPTADGTGIYVRYLAAKWNSVNQAFSTATPVALHPTVTNGHQCVMGVFGYDTSGCEHFGVWTTFNPSRTVYRWLIADPNTPGQLTTYGSTVAIPAPIWLIVPPAGPAEPVQIVAQVDPPIPPPPAKLYGEAQWMKTYKTENERQVGLDELLVDNPAIVPNDAAQLETAWDLIQSDLTAGRNGNRKQKRGPLGGRSHAVVRRFEFYKFTGTIDPVTGQAICADGLCNAPADNEVGDFIGAQNAAVNLNVPPTYQVAVTVSGDGSVSSADRVISCPTGICAQSVNPDTTVTLTAKGARGVFTGWSGACVGTAATCSIVVDSDAPVTATFKSPFKLVTRITGLGSVASNPSGSSFLQGTVVTLTATPAAGNTFTGWSGACAGTATTCTVTINADTTVKAAFSGPVAPPPPASYKLVMKSNGSGSVNSNPTGNSFVSGTSVTVTAVPGSGATWKGWTGSTCSGLALTCTVTMTADTTLTANFR